jgi:hypothetical protein
MLSVFLLIQNKGRLQGLLSFRDKGRSDAPTPGIDIPPLTAVLIGFHEPPCLAVGLA